jgi:hypothetical protein
MGVTALKLIFALSSNDFLHECCVSVWFGLSVSRHGYGPAALTYVRGRAERRGPLHRLDPWVLLVFERYCKSAYRVVGRVAQSV